MTTFDNRGAFAPENYVIPGNSSFDVSDVALSSFASPR